MTTSIRRILASDRFWRVIAWLVGLAGVGYFYRYFFSSGFSRFQGDHGDGRLVPYISSHWSDPTQFNDGWRNLGVFFPVDEALSHSDALLISGIITAPFEWLGMNTFLSFQLFLILLTASSYIFLIKFLKERFETPWLIAITFAFVFTFSNGLFISSNHPQLLYYLLIPSLIFTAHKILENKDKFFINSITLGVLVGLLTISAFYIGFYLILSTSIFSILLFVFLVFDKKVTNVYIIWKFNRNLLLGGALILPLFLLIYLPMIQKNASRSFEMILEFALRPIELFNLSDTNLVWGSILNKYFSQQMRSNNGEYSMAPTWILMLTSLIILFYLIFTYKKLDLNQKISLSLFITAFILWIAPVRFGNFLLWEYLYHLPGVDVIRTIGRLHIFVTGLLSIALAIFFGSYWNRYASKNYLFMFLLIPLLAMLALEQINKLPQQNNFLARDETLEKIIEPPIGCESFLVLKGVSPSDPSWTTQMDAMVLTKKLNMPTWNGYSGNKPENWNLFNLNDENYLLNAATWRDLNNIDNGCGVNLETNSWVNESELNLLISQ